MAFVDYSQETYSSSHSVTSLAVGEGGVMRDFDPFENCPFYRRQEIRKL